MTTKEQKEIFAANLKKYVERSGKMQKEIAEDLDVPPTTFHSWYVGKVIPYWSTIQKLADYFGIAPTQLTDKQSDSDVLIDCVSCTLKGCECEMIKRVLAYANFLKTGGENDEQI